MKRIFLTAIIYCLSATTSGLLAQETAPQKCADQEIYSLLDFWVGEWAANPGGVKEKTLVEQTEGNGVRFQGTISRPDGSRYLDRTTLTPNADGSVRQLIEVSTDDGESWSPTFDAFYRRRE